MLKPRLKTSVLPYTEQTSGEYRDLRQVEAKLGKRFVRVSLNGQYRLSKSLKAHTRYANPGWAFGLDRCFVELVHFKRHCAHLSLNVGKRGVTLSAGRSAF